MTAYMYIGYHIHHSYVACKTNNDHKNNQDLCSGDSSMINWNHAMTIRSKRQEYSTSILRHDIAKRVNTA